jgi:tripartite-type tricarboxylate transporter receptor subunit TctC
MCHRNKLMLLGVVAVGLLLMPFPGWALDFPTKPITLVIPYSPGGATDVTFRSLAEAAKKYFGQPVVPENKPGGSGAVAVGSMVGRKPDGYYVCVIVSVLQRASFQNKFSFDTVKDVTPIISVCGLQYGIVVKPDSQFTTLKSLIDYARANPGKATYMSAGVGSGGHIYMEEISASAGGIQFNHIPSKGDMDAANALLGGHVDFIAVSPGGWMPLAEAGRLKLLTTLGEKRTKRFPDVPTVKELGYNVVHLTPLGLAGPKGLPREITQALHDGFKKAMDDPIFLTVAEKFENPIVYQNSEEFAKYWAASYLEEGERVRKFILK